MLTCLQRRITYVFRGQFLTVKDATMHKIDLGGRWELKSKDGKHRLEGQVPGTVHGDLLAAGKIKDPYYRAQENDVQWVGETDWIYTRPFIVPEDFLKHEKILLVCHGLDTLGEIRLNGRKIAETDNMFRAWEFDAKPFLKAGRNTVEILFNSAFKYQRLRNAERRLPSWVDGGNWLRKEQCNFGWDWGIRLITCGIWRDIGLVGFDKARLKDVQILQKHKGGEVSLDVNVAAEKILRNSQISARISASYQNVKVDEKVVALKGDKAAARIRIEDPELWWPNGMGFQPLYDVSVELLDEDGSMLDSGRRRIGLRTLELQRKKDKWGESFNFAVNGVPFFAKGANWIPADAILSRLEYPLYHRLLSDAAEANMNMLRVWGGGLYEHDCFYDICDELGICIWQDFMFACATYPAFDKEFMATVEAEAKDNVRRLRHHPCMALWCGNNELEQGLVGDEWTDRTMSWKDYGRLFDELLPGIVKELDPQRPYWPGSPHSPVGDRKDFNNPRCGDAHLWSVWHGKAPFEWYRTCEHRFNSEFGFQSFAEPKTVRGFTGPADRNITSPVMEHHQRSGIGNSTIMHYMMDWFRMPSSFDNTLWLSQILQGMAMKYAVEHWRRSMPRGMGTLYWQLNDCWPVTSWASIDYHGRWKALHYMAKKFYNPVLLSAVEDKAAGTVEIHLTSDLLEPVRGAVSWTAWSVQGEKLSGGSFGAVAEPLRSSILKKIDLGKAISKAGLSGILLQMEFCAGPDILSKNMSLFVRPKQVELQKPGISAEVKGDGDSFAVSLRAGKPALWTWLELDGCDARFSDNFFHLFPSSKVEVKVEPTEKMPLKLFKGKLNIRSLVDMY